MRAALLFTLIRKWAEFKAFSRSVAKLQKTGKEPETSLSGPPHEPRSRTQWADPVVTSQEAGASGPRAWTRYVTAARASRQVRSGRWRREPLGRATHGKSSPRVRRGPDGQFFRLVSGFPGSPRGPRGWRLPGNDGAAALPLGSCEIPSFSGALGRPARPGTSSTQSRAQLPRGARGAAAPGCGHRAPAEIVGRGNGLPTDQPPGVISPLDAPGQPAPESARGGLW